ncbi:MAG: UPF0261 family protein [Armatimonadetes bacterium]|nr:UPF0261 family protein [Armatimonadota bacterium]
MVGLVATLDTKGQEAAFLRERLEMAGLQVLVLHCGTHEPQFPPEVSNAEIAAAGGGLLAELRRRGDRGEAVATLARGAAALAAQLYAGRRIQGLISLGGSAGTTIGTAAMRALPVGVPKVMVSTMASGDTRPYVDVKDVAMLYSVVDVAGLNRLSRRILANAAGAMAGMLLAPPLEAAQDRPLIGATMFGVTTPCVTEARRLLEEAGYEVLTFHATGTGGRAMEELVRGGFLAGVLDVTTTELADELVGGILTAGPDRLEAAGAAGLPQVVCPGAIDMVNFGPPESVPERFRDRLFYHHNPTVTLMRTTPEECAELGRITARKLSAAQGPATVLFPRRGVSAIDREGQPFDSPAAREAYLQALREALPPAVPVVELDLHINDPGFAAATVQAFLRRVGRA